VITCTQCGVKNSDETRFCTQCGNKLQSNRQPVPSTDPANFWLEPFRHDGMPPESKLSLLRMVEAWGYVAVLVAVAIGCTVYSTWWPMYPAVGLLGLLAWLRRI